MTRLALILSDDYLSGALEADLLHEYPGQSDLMGQFWRREIPLRKFLTLIKHLPSNARVCRAMSRAPRGTTATEDRLTVLTNLTRQLIWTLCAVNSEKGKSPDRPEFIDHPEPMTLSEPIEKLFTEVEGKTTSTKKHKFADIGQLNTWIQGLNKAD